MKIDGGKIIFGLGCHQL